MSDNKKDNVLVVLQLSGATTRSIPSSPTVIRSTWRTGR